MPLLQLVTNRQGAEVPKGLRINKPATPAAASSSSSSPTPYQHRLILRSKARPTSDLYNLEYPEPLRIRRSTSTTPSPSPPSRPRHPQLSQLLPTNNPLISTPLPPASAPYQHRRLEISAIPLRPRLTPPSTEEPVESAHRTSDPKTPRTPNLHIKRKSTYHTTNEPATPTPHLGNHVLVTTGSTPSAPKSSSRFLSIPPSPFRDEKKPPISSNFDTDAMLPAPLTRTLANRSDIIPILLSPPPKRRRTDIKRKLTVTRRTLSALLPWNPDPTFQDDLQVMDEKLRMTAQAVIKAMDKWRRYATLLPTRSDFDGFQGTTKAALETHGYPGRRVSERLEVAESEEEEEEEEVEARDTVAEQVAEIRGLTLRHLRSRKQVDKTR